METETVVTKAKRGFASMTPERRREVAIMGGKAAQAAGTAHRFTPEEAREAGRRKGYLRWQERQAEGDE